MRPPVIELQNGLYLATKEIANWEREDLPGGGIRLKIMKTDGTDENLFGEQARKAIQDLES